MSPTTLAPREIEAARQALELDGRLLCWRCRGDVDDDLYCGTCGATNVPPAAPRPRTSDELASAIAAPLDAIVKLLLELECAGLAERTPAGLWTLTAQAELAFGRALRGMVDPEQLELRNRAAA